MANRKPYFGPAGDTHGGRKPYFGTDRKASGRKPYFGDVAEPAKHGGRHGVGGLLVNFGGDVVHTVAGLPSGIAGTAGALKHDVGYSLKHGHTPLGKSALYEKVGKPVAKSYAQTYGPLAHGDVSKFLHNLYEHPLGPVLDVLAVATAGGGAAAKAGGVLAKTGRIAEESRLAQLGRVERIKHIGPNGRIVEGKVLSRNPVIRGRQKLTHAALSQVGNHLPFLGETRRFAQEISHLPRQEAKRAQLQMAHYSKAFRKLTLEEQAALHLIGRGVSPDEYLRYLKKQGGVEPEMLRVLENPRIRRLYTNPTARLREAHAEAVKLSRLDAELKIGRGHLTPEEAAARVDLHAAEVGAAEHPRGMGRFYVPDVAAHERLPNADLRKLGGGVGVPKKTGGMKHNKSVLFSTGRLALHGDQLGKEYLSTIKYGLHDDIHSELLSSAVRVAKERIREVPSGYVFLRKTHSERIHALVRKGGAIREQLHELAPDEELKFYTDDSADAATLHGDYLVVPKKLAEELAGEYRKSNRAAELFLEKPTQVWRAIILGYRVGFLTNNLVGNHLMYAVKHGGYNGLVGYLNALKRAGKSRKLIRKLVDETKGADPVTYRKLMEDFFPDQIHDTFGGTQKTNLVGERLKNRPRTKRVVSALEHGIVPATQNIAEQFLRGAAVEAVLRGMPEVRAAMRGMSKDTRTFEAAARKALQENDHLAREVSQKVNDALGDYTSLPSDTQRVMRALFPFFAWYRAITKVTLKLPLDSPVRADALTKIGAIGDQLNKDALGPLPDFLLNLIPLGGDKVLTTGGLNPYVTETQLGAGAKGVLVGHPGDTGRAAAQLGLNPLIQGAIENLSGKELFSGRDIEGGHGLPLQVVRRVGGQLPQVQMYQGLRGRERPAKSFAPRTMREQLINQFTGLSVRDLNRGYANSRAQR